MAALLVYIIIINLVAMTAMGIDKKRAIDHKWRIPEKRLFLYVIIGGGVGGCCGMWLFRHKTKHWYFKLFFPLITIAEYVILFFVLRHFGMV